jgi:hypothetical protein
MVDKGRRGTLQRQRKATPTGLMSIRKIAMRILGFLRFLPLPAYAFLQIPGMSRITQIEVPASVQRTLRADAPGKWAYDFWLIHVASLFLAAVVKKATKPSKAKQRPESACGR